MSKPSPSPRGYPDKSFLPTPMKPLTDKAIDQYIEQGYYGKRRGEFARALKNGAQILRSQRKHAKEKKTSALKSTINDLLK